jgi:hypothetical protein
MVLEKGGTFCASDEIFSEKAMEIAKSLKIENFNLKATNFKALCCGGTSAAVMLS